MHGKDQAEGKAENKSWRQYPFPAGYDGPMNVCGSNDLLIGARLKGAANGIIDYGSSKRPVFGFMGTTPLKWSVRAHNMFLGMHPNNIGEHTSSIDEQGFSGTQQLEREVIGMLGDLHGDASAAGYLCSGGTEANLEGLWIGREYLMKNVDAPNDNRICLLTSCLGHYSVIKAYRLLRLGGELASLPVNERGEVLVSAMRAEIDRLYKSGFRRFIIVAIAGTTLFGSIDDVGAIGEMMAQLRQEQASRPDKKRAGFYLHVDAAYGGFVTPFLCPPYKVGFDAHQEVKSITIDPHKMGLATYPAGAFLCRRGLMDYISAEIGYVGGHRDVTVCGSRPGATAAACWAAMNALGRKGYTEIVSRCIEVTRYFKQRLDEINGIKNIEPTMNIVASIITDKKAKQAIEDLEKGVEPNDDEQRKLAKIYRRIQKKYLVVSSLLRLKTIDGDSDVRVIRHVLMPHPWLIDDGEKVIDGFMAEFRKLFSGGGLCQI